MRKPNRKSKLPKLPKLPDRGKLENKLDELHSIYVRRRDGSCVNCGSIYNLTNGHYITRRKHRLRWDLRNENCQCRDCNGKHRYYQYIYEGYMRRHYGDVVLDELEMLANIPAFKWSITELEEMTIEIKKLIAELS